ncbi:MAG: protein-(glutamine-N5) methyltransferase, release factor-specific [Legionellaceae bacterium]|nr:protein-(glutamine-N5) methyltransferase, release factor-specific [Legionellaceae bacterium]
MNVTVEQTLSRSVELLPRSATPKLDVEILLQYTLGVNQAKLYAYPERVLTQTEQTIFAKHLRRRQVGEPIAYIVGEKEFFSLPLKITADVLVPRPETELLVELVLQLLPQDKKVRLIDLGTGSGAIALALAHNRPNWEIYASDKSSAALSIAKENADHLQLGNIQFIQSDWCATLPTQQYDLIVSNPPYVDPMDAHLQSDGLLFEPQSALVADDEGFADLFIIAEQAGSFLHKDGWLLLEHGNQQGEKLANYLREKGFSDVSAHLDLAGQVRATLARY